MDFQLLGPFTALHEGRPVRIGTRRQERCLLAILLLHAGHSVPTDRLIDLLWSDRSDRRDRDDRDDRDDPRDRDDPGHQNAPTSPRPTIHTYVGRLRQALKSYGVQIETTHDGYTVDLPPDSVDTHRFTTLARRAADTTDPAEQLRLYDQALALWRGPLLADLADDHLRARLGTPLTDLRLSAVERRAEAQLTLGRYDDVVATPVEEHPPRERLVAARMTALHRTGRRTEALDLYRRTREVLVTEYDTEPGEDLQTLHDRIVRGDHRLNRPPGPVYAVRVDDQWLPWNTSGHPALEFCNTYAGWATPDLPGAEWLRTYATLAVWAGHMDLTDPRTVTRLRDQALRQPADAAAELARAREFRTHLYACLTDPGDTRAFASLARTVEEAAAHSVFVRDESGVARWRLSPGTGLRLPLHAIAQKAGELLVSTSSLMVRQCQSDTCGWLFLDASGLRRWCSLATCGGNRVPNKRQPPGSC
ncbi:ABATE domain-containing protein [Streptomyces roseirectus]|uniref:ABATE domain-containing protein n=1 Tax=Streptomyces roseirectus TaxID=2768066 RepID=A0A7H0IER8_9ACTN|nr:BTAD domain-containing putative transcriptional regulator [Streptomyces roseirectus]QNP71284.1 ABATE domain-containing protein [Streptomyces roseirectus]